MPSTLPAPTIELHRSGRGNFPPSSRKSELGSRHTSNCHGEAKLESSQFKVEVGDESPCFELLLVPESLIQLISGTDPASFETEGGIYSDDIQCSNLQYNCCFFVFFCWSWEEAEALQKKERSALQKDRCSRLNSSYPRIALCILQLWQLCARKKVLQFAHKADGGISNIKA